MNTGCIRTRTHGPNSERHRVGKALARGGPNDGKVEPLRYPVETVIHKILGTPGGPTALSRITDLRCLYVLSASG